MLKNRIPSWLRKPWLLPALGLLLLALLIWFEGPLLAFDGREPLATARSRWTLIAILFLLAAAIVGWRHWRAWRRNRQLMQGVAQQGGAPDASAAEVRLLGERMQEAMAVLRKSNPGWRMRSQYLYQLPWFLFVGAPGSGKTTALLRSGLHFPLAEALGPGAVGGVGGTRNCDWWFTDEAVLLDTAGRYTTQDSGGETDKAAWHGFLALLKKHRRRQPINGVVVALSVADLLQQGELARTAQATAIRARLQELRTLLGISFPVYVMVTKSDLLPGFAEFFDTFGRDERAQAWGMTFPLAAEGKADAALAAFPAEFMALEGQLQARVLERMQQERDLQRRALLYGFPQQFAALQDVLGRFLQGVFAANRYEADLMLRGLYFSSGVQEGSPIDRIMAALANSFGLGRRALAPGADSGRSYFITRLLREVVFHEASLAGLDPERARRRRMLEWGALAGGALLAVLLATGLTISYARNQDLVADSDKATGEVAKLAARTPSDGNALAALPLLNAARALPAGYAERGASVPVLNRMSLYQGEKLGDGAVAAYRRLLRSTLMPRIVDNLETALRRGDANSQDFLYETLRVYLMLGQRQYFDGAAVQAWVELSWQGSLPQASEAQRKQLLAHAAALLDDDVDASEPIRLDAALVAQARLTLAGMPLPQRIYNRVKRQVVAQRLPEFSVNSALGRDGSPVFARSSGAPLSRGVSGVYSLAGYRKLLELKGQAVAELARDSWVLDRQESASSLGGAAVLEASMLELYYADYIRHWDAFLADVKLAPLNSLDQGARVANALAGADSPLRALLLAAARETKLQGAQPVAGEDGVERLVKGKLESAKRQLAAALGSEEGGPAPAVQNPVDQHFASLHRLASGGLDAMLAAVKDAALYFDAAESARRSGAPAPSDEALQRLRRAAEGQPGVVSGVLQNLGSSGSGLAQGSERARLSALWRGAGAQFCSDAIAGRYPLARGASRDATLDDFGRFFAPGGMMDDFFNKHLAAMVDMSGAQWRWRSAAAGLSQEALDQFQRGARLRDAFFAAGGRQPAWRFELRPAAVDAAFSRLTLDIDGQPVAWQPGQAARATAVVLPSGKGDGEVRFDAAPALDAELRTSGPWAWLRMMDRGVIESVQGERYRIRFDLGGRKAVYELTAASVINPFRREALELFRCPASL